MRKKLFLLLSVFLCTSCNEKPLSKYEEFAKKYNEYYPNGYDAEARWYEYEKVSMSYSFKNSKKQIGKSKFTGYIDFDKNQLVGFVTKFERVSEFLDIENDEIICKKKYFSCLNDKHYYYLFESIYEDESKNIKETEGCKNVENLRIDTRIDGSDFFSVNGYENLLKIERFYQSINIYEDHVTFNRKLSFNDYEIIHTRTEYYFDNEYKLYQVIQYEDVFYDEDHPYVIRNNYTHSTSVAWLKFGDDKQIEVPTNYDKEFNQEDRFMYIFL